MPQVFALMLAGAGLYAGYRWLARQVMHAADDARAAREDLSRRAAQAGAGLPKDLGELEWDERAGVYRPRQQS